MGVSAYNENDLPPDQCGNDFVNIRCPSSADAHRRVRAGVSLTTHHYKAVAEFSDVSLLDVTGAPYSSELPLLFDTHYEYRGNESHLQVGCELEQSDFVAVVCP